MLGVSIVNENIERLVEAVAEYGHIGLSIIVDIVVPSPLEDHDDE